MLYNYRVLGSKVAVQVDPWCSASEVADRCLRARGFNFDADEGTVFIRIRTLILILDLFIEFRFSVLSIDVF